MNLIIILGENLEGEAESRRAFSLKLKSRVASYQ